MMKQSTPLYTLSGVVIHGRGVGKHVGTPTADLALGPGSHLPPSGVYASRAASGNVCWYGVTSVGRRPTLHNDCVPSVETHLFDFAGDLYGQPLLLELHCRLRAIQRFDDLTQLLEQIRQQLLPPAQVQAMADHWRRLQQENAPLRVVESGTVVSTGIDYYDGLIRQAIPSEPCRTANIIGRALAVQKVPTGDFFIARRLEHFIQTGELAILERDGEGFYNMVVGRRS